MVCYNICPVHCPKNVLTPLQFLFLKKKKNLLQIAKKLCVLLEIPHLKNFQKYTHSHWKSFWAEEDVFTWR